jgi:hypothetical protein
MTTLKHIAGVMSGAIHLKSDSINRKAVFLQKTGKFIIKGEENTELCSKMLKAGYRTPVVGE